MVSNGEDYICDLPRSKVENLLVDYCNANASPAEDCPPKDMRIPELQHSNRRLLFG